MVKPGLITDDHAVSFDCTLPGSAEQVWFHLTDPVGLKRWLAEGHIEPRPRGALRLLFESDEALVRSDSGLLIRGVVSRYAPYRSLAYSWIDAPREANGARRLLTAPAASMVTFELAPRDRHTWLSLTHAGLPTHLLSRVGAGWHAHLRLLIEIMSSTATVSTAPLLDHPWAYGAKTMQLRAALRI